MFVALQQACMDQDWKSEVSPLTRKLIARYLTPEGRVEDVVRLLFEAGAKWQKDHLVLETPFGGDDDVSLYLTARKQWKKECAGGCPQRLPKGGIVPHHWMILPKHE